MSLIQNLPTNKAHTIQIINGNQRPIITRENFLKAVELCRAAYGTREFSLIQITNSFSNEVSFYLNEWIAGQPEVIEDDNLYTDLANTIENYMASVKGYKPAELNLSKQ
jgi:hypothetical protein